MYVILWGIVYDVFQEHIQLVQRADRNGLTESTVGNVPRSERDY